MCEARVWAEEEFGQAALGDARRTKRLVRLATAYAEQPAGTVTQVVSNAAEREAAYRLLENPRVDAAAIGAASHQATARRSRAETEVIVPLDQTSLTVTDRTGKPGFGATAALGGRGLQIMTALALRSDGTTLGVLAQQWWSRTVVRGRSHRSDPRPPEERESVLWERALRQAEEALAASAPSTRAWYQLDRGGDSNRVLELALERGLWLTVRSAYNRTIGDKVYLHTWMRKRRPVGYFNLTIPKTSKRPRGRTASISLRASKVEVRLNDPKGRPRRTVTLWCVHVRERRPPRDVKRLEWFLLTTFPVTSAEEASRVVRNYAYRWRIEEFHRAWKSGVCQVEHSQLRSADAFKRWATIAAAVAARAERLKSRSRNEPDAPATVELSRAEIDAAILLTEKSRFARGDDLTLAQAVRLIADIGGYTGKSSGGPPGGRVIQRGLDRVLPVATVLERLERSG